MQTRAGVTPVYERIQVPNGIERLCGVMCGCGQPERAWDTIQDFLEEYGQIDDQWNQRDIHFLNSGERYIVAYLLDHLELTEHGGSVGGAWLTHDGENARDFLRKYGIEFLARQDIEFFREDGVGLN